LDSIEHKLKLPGSLVYEREDFDLSAKGIHRDIWLNESFVIDFRVKNGT
jgi:hypothetical protein